MTFVTRFAPSPTGHLHLGHAYSALLGFEAAAQAGGRFILRIEDIDQGRCRDEFVQGIYDDLEWLGLEWEAPVRVQSHHMADYQKALDALYSRGLIYPCFCTRAEIKAEIERAPSAPHGPDGPLYPGTCRSLPIRDADERKEAGVPHAWRLNLEKALESLQDAALGWHEDGKGFISAEPKRLGDVVLARKDTPASYHLAVTHDDALQGVTHIIRGEDLFYATHIHRLLQALMGWPAPTYVHHPLLKDENGVRFAKRHKSETLSSLRASGVTAEDVRKRLGFSRR